MDEQKAGKVMRELVAAGRMTDPDSARGKLLQAAAHLFRRKGYERTTVRDLATAVGIQSGIAVLRQIDPSIEEAAQNLGATTLTTFRKVTLPLIAPAFFSGLVYAFVRAMTAISAAIFLVSANWNLMTVQILNQVGSGRLGVSAAFSVVVIVIVLIAIAVISFAIGRWSRHTSMVRF